MLLAPAHGNLSPYGGLPIYTSPTEMMGNTISLAMKGGLVAAVPVAVISVYTLVSPLLDRRQRRFILLTVPAVLACYLIGAAFAYYVMLPTGLVFLLHFGDGIAVPVISITEYMTLVTAMLFWLGIVFELPLVMFMLTKLRLVKYERFQKMHFYVPLAALILGALITPTFDMVNQALVAGPILLLYEFGLILSRLARPKPLGHKTIRQRVKARLALMWWRFTSWWL